MPVVCIPAIGPPTVLIDMTCIFWGNYK